MSADAFCLLPSAFWFLPSDLHMFEQIILFKWLREAVAKNAVRIDMATSGIPGFARISLIENPDRIMEGLKEIDAMLDSGPTTENRT